MSSSTHYCGARIGIVNSYLCLTLRLVKTELYCAQRFYGEQQEIIQFKEQQYSPEEYLELETADDYMSDYHDGKYYKRQVNHPIIIR